MRLASKLFVVLLLPVLLLATVGVVLLWTNHRIGRLSRQEAVVDEVTRGTFELNMLTYEHLRRPTERTRQQWQQKHGTLKLLLGSVEFASEADRLAHAEARRGLVGLGGNF
ncbi:MAG: hypothetical protein N3B01_12385, partial [Verrucomicrobiae bacterium]|nr:hypothetical protein [Verrucomicrobiae bacterium]